MRFSPALVNTLRRAHRRHTDGQRSETQQPRAEEAETGQTQGRAARIAACSPEQKQRFAPTSGFKKVRPFRKKLLRLTLAAIASISTAAGLSAQELISARLGDTSPEPGGNGTGSRKSLKPGDADPGAKVRREAEVRQRTWDRKMKAVSGSICQGC